MRFSTLLAATALTALSSPVLAEDLTLDRVFASPSLEGSSVRGLRLSPDGKLLTSLRARDDDRLRYDLWAMDTTTGEWRMLVDSEKVGSGAELSEAEKMQRERARVGGLRGIINYDWSADGQSILVPIDGDLYLAGIDGSVQQLTDTPEGELNPKLSEGGGYVSFVRDRRLFVGALGAEPQPITPLETSEQVYWGEAEFVAQEEMGRRTGYWWSPDDQRIAVQRFDESPVDVVTRTAIGAAGTSTFDQRYPAAGTDNVLNQLWVINVADGSRVEVDLGEETDIYLARVNWAPDGSKLYVQRQNRAQTVLDMLVVDPATGESAVLFSEQAADGHWTNLSSDYKFLDDGGLIWWSERDGWGHLYHRSADGEWRQLTQGEWVVRSLTGVNQESGTLYFDGTKDDVLAGSLYALDYRTPGAEAVRISEAGFTYGASMDEAGTRVIVSRSSPSQPAQTYLAGPNGDRIAWINENALDDGHPYSRYMDSHILPKYGSITAPDGTALYYRMTLPANMEPGKRYPVLFQHYGGPGGQTVTRGWGGALEQWIVDQGYISFELDNRGSPNRGVDFEKPIYRAMGGIEVSDRKIGADWLKTLDFVDPDRIAVYGWSYGGYMTLKMLAADQGLYAAGVAGAPVSKWEYYDTHYTERYMGDPRTDKAAYDKASTFNGYEKISDPLLIIHGMSDDNVVLDNSTSMAAALQEARVPFEMMFYPGYTHRVGGPNISVHLWETIMRFLERNGVPPGAR